MGGVCTSTLMQASVPEHWSHICDNLSINYFNLTPLPKLNPYLALTLTYLLSLSHTQSPSPSLSLLFSPLPLLSQFFYSGSYV